MTEHPVYVKVAQHAVGGETDLLVTLGLGSCVAVLLHDEVARIGGLAHILLPDATLARDRSNPSKFVDTAVPFLVEALRERGARRARLRARLTGGASMFANLMTPGTPNMGERNIAAARKVLKEMRIPLVAEEVGADYGRSVRFRVRDGRVVIASVGRQDVTL